MAIDVTGSLSGYAPNLINMAKYGGGIVVAIVICVAVMYLVLFKKKYKIPVTIYSVRKDGQTVVSRDLGHISREKGKECMILKETRAILPPPPFEYGLVDAKGVTHFYIIQVGINEFRYAMPEINNFKEIMLSPDQRDIIAWSVYAKSQFEQMFSLKNWLEKYAPYLILALAIGGIIAMFAVIADNISEAITLAQSILAQAKSTAVSNSGVVPV